MKRYGSLALFILIASIAGAQTDDWQSGTMVYDGSGNLIAIGANAYGYDAVGRLSESTTSGTIETYDYDAFGNLIHKEAAGRPNVVPPIDSQKNRIAGETYDDAGNLTTHGSESFVYDPFNMVTLMRTTSAHRKRYIYTADDERIGSQVDASMTQWKVRDFGGAVLSEFEGSSAETWEWVEDYVYADGRLAAAERSTLNGGMRHFHPDHLGTPRVISNAAAQKLAIHEYFPFGVERTAFNQEMANFGHDRPEPMKFTGHERDFHGGNDGQNTDYLDYMHARYYSPNIGRLLTVDPVADSILLESPQTWNRYAYALNSPINNVDPDGLCTYKLADGTIHEDTNAECIEVKGKEPHWSAAEIRARGEAAADREKGEFLRGIPDWGSLRLTFAKGRGGSFTIGKNDGQWFWQSQAGLGYGAGFKWDPTGRLPTPEDGSTPPRAFLGPTATASLSIGPLSFDWPLRTGAIIFTTPDGKPDIEGHSSWRPKLTFKWKQGWGLEVRGLAGGDAGFTFDIFD